MCMYLFKHVCFILIFFFEVVTDNFHLLPSIYSLTPGHVPKQLCDAQNFGDLVILLE